MIPADSTKTATQQGRPIVSDSAEFQLEFIQKSLKRIEEKQEDWLTRYAPTALGLLGIISGTFVVYFQNRNRIGEKRAEFRVQWNNDLRDNLTRYIFALQSVNRKIKLNQLNILNDEDYREAEAITYKLILMINPNPKNNQDERDLLAGIQEFLSLTKQHEIGGQKIPTEKLTEIGDILFEKSRAILKKEWEKAKNFR